MAASLVLDSDNVEDFSALIENTNKMKYDQVYILQQKQRIIYNN